MGTDTNDFWAIVDTIGGQFIGRVIACTDTHKDDMTHGAILESEIITLDPAYKIEVQYLPTPMPNGQVGFSKQVLISNYSILSQRAAIHITGLKNVCFFDEMHEDDRKSLRTKLEGIGEENKKQAAKASGLVLLGKG